MKTIEDILDSQRFGFSKEQRESALKAMQSYSNQQIELAVDKTLSVFVSNGKDSLEFRTLRTQILNEIKDR